MNRQFLQVVVLVLLLVTSVETGRAQAPAAQGSATEQAPYRPPSMRFDGAGLTLVDAIRLTLQNDPTIKLRDADLAFQRGVLRSQKGLFDASFRADGNFGRNQAELLESQKLDQQEIRTDLASAIVEVTALTQSLATAGALLQDKNQAYNNPGAMNLTNIRDPSVFAQMSILQSELVLYRDILASSSLTDATVRTDIVNLREQTVGKNIDYFNSQQAAIAGIPAQMQTSLDNLGPSPEEQWDKQNFFTAEFFKRFRSGITMRPYVDLRYRSQNFVGKTSFNTEFGGMGSEPISSGKIGFDVVVPLLRGAGSGSVAAAETAAKYDVEASRLVMLFQQSQSVLTTIQAYWQARAAAAQVDVLRQSVETQGELGNSIRSLIAANQRPRSEETRILASTADARSRYESAQRQLTEARIALAQAMGIALADALSIPLAGDPYPLPPAGLQTDPQAYAAFIKEAVGRRFDRQAAVQAENSGKALVEGARRDLRPFLDLNLSGWGTGGKEGSFGYGDWVFRSGSVGLTYEKLLGNNSAGGILEAQRSALRRTQIDSADLERAIALRIIQLSESLKVAADRLRSSQEAVLNYDQTITNERARLAAGTSSLLDTIQTEQQATGARLAYIAAQQEYASLLAQLRHEAGLLVQDGSVDGAQLLVVPPALVRR